MATVPVKTSIGCMEFGRQCSADQVCCTECMIFKTCVIICIKFNEISSVGGALDY